MIVANRSLAEFICEYEIHLSCRRVGKNPNMDSSGWGKEARHWRCLLTCGATKETMVVPFSQGSAHVQPPTTNDLLSCLADDSASVVNARSFEDWANDLGFDPDSRKDERSYNACVKQADDLQRLLGPEAYEELLWQTERD